MPFLDTNKPCCRRSLQHVCSKCSTEFLDAESLISHLVEHSSSENYHCSICEDTFNGSDLYVNHLERQPVHKRDLHQIACSGRYELLNQFLHTQRADVTGDSHKIVGSCETYNHCHVGYTPMHCATFGDHSQSLKILLSWEDGDPNCNDPIDGRTPVHIAASKGFVRCLKLLLKSGGNIFAKDKQGKTPLAFATEACRVVFFRHYIEEMSTGTLVCGVEGFSSFLQYWSQLDKNSERYEEKIKEISDEIVKGQVKTTLNDGSIAVRQRMDVELHVSEMCSALNQYHISKENNGLLAREVEEEPSRVPYEILARGKAAIKAFKKALQEDTATVSHIQLTVLGEIGAGKTSLVRMLSGQEFKELREETHGIDTSMVESTELDTSWHIVDSTTPHVDKVVAKIVCNRLRNANMAANRGIEGATCSPELLAIPESPTTECVSGSNPDDPFAFDTSSKLRKEMPCEEIEKLLREGYQEQDFRSVKVSLWDFAGHRLYEPMHHVFLNRRSMYLVVFSLVRFKENEESALDSLYYWLNSVRVHTPRSTPIYLVGTHLNSVTAEDVRAADRALNVHFGESFCQQLVRSAENSYLFSIDNSLPNTEKEVDLLKAKIIKEASQLDHVQEKLPVRWFQFEEAILRHDCPPFNKKCVPKSELLQVAQQECSGMDDEEFEKMLHFFHDTGVVILPDELMGPSCNSHFPSLKDQVVLEPQYLVDVMTRIYDIPKNTQMKRKFSGQWKNLKRQGIADCKLLKHAWEGLEGLEDSTNTVTGLLVASGMLCPMQISLPPDISASCESSGEERLEQSEDYIVPCHLPRKSLGSKWAEQVDGFEGPVKVLYFDFNPCLPPSLFHHIAVRIILHSELTKGIKPKIRRWEGIFSIGDEFIFKIERLPRHNQLKVLARFKDVQQGPPQLLRTLRELVTDVCSQYFKFLKFVAGPPCPSPKCPGALNEDFRFHLPSSDSSNDEEDAVCGKLLEDDKKQNPAVVRSISDERRTHVIGVDPNSAPQTVWCDTVRLQCYPEVKQWYCCRKSAECDQEHSNNAVKNVEFKLAKVDPAIKERIGRMLDLETVGVGDARRLAREYGMDELDVRGLDSCAGEKVLQFLSAKEPNLTVHEFCDTLKKLNRNDIVVELTTNVKL